MLQYKNFIEQIYVRSRKVYWSGFELGSGRDHVEEVLGKPLQLEQNIGDELFFVKTYYHKMHVKLWFEFTKPDASLLGITIGFGGFMLSELEIKKLEDCLKRRIPNVKKHFFAEHEESYAWKVKGIDSIKIIIKGDGLAIGSDRYFDFWD